MVVALRTLTRTSKFDQGKYVNQKIDTIINIDPNYIIWVYFKIQRVTFVNEILDSVGVTEGYRIIKPSTSDEMLHKFNVDRLNSMSKDEKIVHFKKNKKKRIAVAKQTLRQHTNDDRRIFSKSSLQSMNQRAQKLDLSYRSIDGKKQSPNK